MGPSEILLKVLPLSLLIAKPMAQLKGVDFDEDHPV